MPRLPRVGGVPLISTDKTSKDKTMKKTARSLSMLALAALLFAAPAFADTLDLTLTSPIQIGTPNGTLTFEATVTAPLSNSGTVYLNGDSSSLSLAGSFIDDTDFLTNSPLSMDPGDTFTADLFTISLPAVIAPGTYYGFFEILGGSDSGAQDILSTIDFQIPTPTAVPEPGTWLLLSTGVSVLAMLVCGRRKTLASSFAA